MPFDLLRYLHQGIFFFVGSSLAGLTPLWPLVARDLPHFSFLPPRLHLLLSAFYKLPFNKLENTHPGVIRRPQTLVICLPALPGERGEEERRTARISSSSSSSRSPPWLGILSEVRGRKNRLVFALPDNRRRSAICLKKKKKDSIHPYLFNAAREYTRRRGRKGRRRRNKKNFATYGVLLTANQQTVGDWSRGRQVGSNRS